MEKIKIVFLGTGGSIPTENRNHTSIFMRYRDRNMLIDCGEGAQRQIRKAGLSAHKITDILITHFHGDHFFGLFGLLNSLSKNNYNKVLNIYGPKGSKKMIKKILDISNSDIKIFAREVRGKFIESEHFSVTAVPLEHLIPCNGYFFEEKDKLRVDKKKIVKYNLGGVEIGKIVKKKNIKKEEIIKWKDVTYLEKGRKIGFVLDTKNCSNIKKILKNTDLAIMESSFLDDEKELARKYKHLTLNQAIKTAKESNVKNLILTHISQRYENKEKIFLNKIKKMPNVKIAYDLMNIEI